MSQEPFFVIGTKRGGTTLLRMMINSHPDIAIPPESHFIIPMLKQVSATTALNRDEQKKVRKIILQGGRFNTWSTTEEELAVLFDQFPDSILLQEIIDAVFKLEISKIGKSKWGDKTPEYIDMIDGLSFIFPKAKFIFLIRDGRDVIDSLKSKGWEGWSVYQRSKYWSDGVRGIFDFMASAKRNSLLIKYEDLVRHSERELRRICSFLGEAYSPKMLEYHLDYERNITKVEKENNIHTKLSRLPSEADVQKWKRSSSKRQLFLAESVMHKELKALSYDLSVFKPVQPMHQLRALGYGLFNKLNDLLFFTYHRLLNAQLRNFISHTLLGKTLRKLVKSS